jgi:hypothetical protein
MAGASYDYSGCDLRAHGALMKKQGDRQPTLLPDSAAAVQALFNNAD